MDGSGDDRFEPGDGGEDLETPQEPLSMRLLKSITMAVLAILLALGVMHFVLPPLNSEQKTPTRHPGGACVACHMVTDSAKTIEVD